MMSPEGDEADGWHVDATFAGEDLDRVAFAGVLLHQAAEAGDEQAGELARHLDQLIAGRVGDTRFEAPEIAFVGETEPEPAIAVALLRLVDRIRDGDDVTAEELADYSRRIAEQMNVHGRGT